jgi:hypothetical protein
MDVRFARTGVATAAGGATGPMSFATGASSDRAIEGAGLVGGAGGASVTTGPGAGGFAAGGGSTFGLWESGTLGGTVRASLLGTNVRRTGFASLESAAGFARSGVGCFDVGAVGVGAGPAVSMCSSNTGGLPSIVGAQRPE